MAQIRGTGSYGMAAPSPFGGQAEDRTEQSPLDAIRQQTSKIEDLLDTVSEPIKPCVSLRSHSLGAVPGPLTCAAFSTPTASCPPSAAS
jgi:hypothetical protein